MKVVEYGKSNSEVIILLHGGGLSWWNYKEVGELLKDRYHVLIPILDGHSGSDRDFTSIESNALEIVEYIDSYYHGSVDCIGGLSLGGQILVEILSLRKNICRYAFIESTLVIPMNITNKLVKLSLDMSYGLIKYHWFSKLQFKSLRIQDQLYDQYYKDTCAITKKNLTSFLKANSSYILKDSLKYNEAKVLICVGEKEQALMIKSAYMLNHIFKNSQLVVMKNRYHGELSINDPKEYVNMISRLLEDEYEYI